jgi:heat shock protein HslJ
MNTHIRAVLAGLLAAALLGSLAACGSDDDTGDSDGGASPDDPSAAAAPPGVADRDWVSTSVTEQGSERPLVSDTRIALSFDDGQVQASAGCNSLFGAARWDGSTLVVSGMGGTEMGCPPDLMEQDSWLVGLLTSSPDVVVSGDQLTLTSGDTVVTFLDREVAIPDAELEGTTWVLDGIGTGGDDDGAVSSVPAGVRSTLTIKNGKLGVEPGCNTGGGSVDVTDDSLVIGPIFTTKKYCGGARMQVEQTVLGVLVGEVDYEIDESTLTLEKDDTVLFYRAAPPR